MKPPGVDSLPILIVSGKPPSLSATCFSQELNRHITLEEIEAGNSLAPHFDFAQACLQTNENYSLSELIPIFELARRFRIDWLWYAGAWVEL